MKFYNIDDFSKFFCIDCCFRTNNTWIEKTSILSYFFLKTACIFNVNEFIDKYMFNTQIHNNILDFYNFIKINIKKINFLKEFDILDYHAKSLRMTVYEFNWNNIPTL
tara:strand:+ start:36 stop:359 length:324 start_codon:yes stop_codon:yes gene_type:complete